MNAVDQDVAADTEGFAEGAALLRELVGAQRLGEAAVQGIIARRLRDAGCEVSELDYDPAEVELVNEFATEGMRAPERRVAVTADLPGDPALNSLLLFAHPDSEPVAGTERWQHDPFAGVIEGSRFYGWGVADDLAGCAAAVLAIEHAVKDKRAMGRIVFSSTPSKRHARGIAAVLHGVDVTTDASLYLHPAESGEGMGEIKAMASGQLEFKVTVHGRRPPTTEPGHTSFSHLAINPIDKAVKLHGALARLAEERAKRVKHPKLETAVGRSTNIQVSSIRCGEMRRFSRIATECEFGGAVSFPPGEVLASVQAEVEKAIADCVATDDFLRDHPPIVEWLVGVTGAEVPDSHPFYRATSEAVRRVTGREPFVNPMHTSSDIRNPAVQKGIPTLGLGCLCGDLTQNERIDEWVDVADFVRMVSVTSAVVADWCSMRAERRSQ